MKPTARIMFLAAVLAVFLLIVFANPRLAGAKSSKARLIETLTALKSGTMHGLTMGGVFRYSLHVPESYDPVLGATLVIFCPDDDKEGTPEKAMNSILWCEEMKDKVVVVPYGSGPGGSFFYRAGDTKTILKLIKELEGPKHRLVFPVKIAAGHKNGACFAYTMLNYYDAINAILASCGTVGIYGGVPQSAAKARKQPVVLLSSDSEDRVNDPENMIDTDIERFQVAGYEKFKYFHVSMGGLDSRAFGEGLAWLGDICAPARAAYYLALAKAYSKKKDYSTAMEFLRGAEACAAGGPDAKAVSKAAGGERDKIDKKLKKELARILKMKAAGDSGWAEALAAFGRKYPGTGLLAKDEDLAAELKSVHDAEGGRLLEKAKAAMQAYSVGRAYALYYKILYDYPLASCAAEARKEIDRIERDRLYRKKAEEYSKAKYDTAFSTAMRELREDNEDAAVAVLRQFIVDNPGGAYSRRARYIVALIE